jgi:hypothetical protein
MSAQMRASRRRRAKIRAYGLDRPAATVRAGTAEAPVVLHLGRQADDDTVYATIEGRPEIFTVDTALLDAVRRDAGEYRQKDLFDARAFNTTRLEVTRDGRHAAFEKRAVKTEGGREEPVAAVAPAEGDVDGALVDSVIFAATSARAESVRHRPAEGAGHPNSFVVIRFDEGGGRTASASGAAATRRSPRARMRPASPASAAATLDDIIKAIEDLP